MISIMACSVQLRMVNGVPQMQCDRHLMQANGNLHEAFIARMLPRAVSGSGVVVIYLPVISGATTRQPKPSAMHEFVQWHALSSQTLQTCLNKQRRFVLSQLQVQSAVLSAVLKPPTMPSSLQVIWPSDPLCRSRQVPSLFPNPGQASGHSQQSLHQHGR